MHSIEDAKKLQCRVVGLFTVQNRTKLPAGFVGMNGSETVEVKIQTLQCCADECGHWVAKNWRPEDGEGPRGRCGLAR